MAAGHRLQQAHGPGVTKSKAEHFAKAVNGRTRRALNYGKAPEHLTLKRGKRPIVARHDPRRRSLKHMQLVDVRLDRGHELNGRRAGADYGNTAVLDLKLMVPARGMKHAALEGFQAF